MTQELKDAIALIDAAVFNSDTFLLLADRDELVEKMERWERAFELTEDDVCPF